MARHLQSVHGTPDLGNQADPLSEGVYILLTYQTDLERARSVYTSLRARYTTWQLVAAAPDLEDILRPSGFQKSRALLVRNLLESVRTRFGTYSLNALRDIDEADAERELRRLPGLDTKGARCIRLYSFGHRVFPVDSNTFRIFRRYGVLKRDAIYRRRALHNELQQLVAPAYRHGLHVNLVAHGQTVCRPTAPSCGTCTLSRSCQRNLL
ncbi:MAG: hypothetical protein KC776_34275 [Myxococcales bacterium]|nr:hypothetical protein [Myxococcales bacterium]